jgi:hypothetical protein
VAERVFFPQPNGQSFQSVFKSLWKKSEQKKEVFIEKSITDEKGQFAVQVTRRRRK